MYWIILKTILCIAVLNSKRKLVQRLQSKLLTEQQLFNTVQFTLYCTVALCSSNFLLINNLMWTREIFYIGTWFNAVIWPHFTLTRITHKGPSITLNMHASCGAPNRKYWFRKRKAWLNIQKFPVIHGFLMSFIAAVF